MEPIAQEPVMMIEDFEEDDDDMALPSTILPQQQSTLLQVFSPNESPRDKKSFQQKGDDFVVVLEPFG